MVPQFIFLCFFLECKYDTKQNYWHELIVKIIKATSDCVFSITLFSSALMQRSDLWWKVAFLGTARMAKPATSLTAAASTQEASNLKPQASGERSRRASAKILGLKPIWRSLRVWVNQEVSRSAEILQWAWPPLLPIPPRVCSRLQVRLCCILVSSRFHQNAPVCLL